jgi:ribonuclease M5
MKKIINGIIVVEGITDVAFLSQFIDAEFVTTNGSDVPDNTIEYLRKSAENRDIFVLTDPDSPGKKIRDVLDQNIPNLKHCFISKENSIKNNKVGVAESTKEEVLTALEKYISSNKQSEGKLTIADLTKLGLVGDNEASFKREKVIQKFRLGHCNAKTFLKRINYSGLKLEDIKNCL